jgi:hypothetical protein
LIRFGPHGFVEYLLKLISFLRLPWESKGKIMVNSKFQLLLLLHLLISISSWGQTKTREKFISLNFSYYRQTEKPFSFKKEDLTNFEFSKGIFICPAYTEFINKRLLLTAETGLGIFQRKSIIVRDTLREFNNKMIPVSINAKFQAVKKSAINLTLVLGGGFHTVLYKQKNIFTMQRNNETYSKLSYLYGLEVGIKLKKQLWLAIGYSITTVGNIKFKSGSIFIPIYGL